MGDVSRSPGILIPLLPSLVCRYLKETKDIGTTSKPSSPKLDSVAVELVSLGSDRQKLAPGTQYRARSFLNDVVMRR